VLNDPCSSASDKFNFSRETRIARRTLAEMIATRQREQEPDDDYDAETLALVRS
jgi:hypothetical protein